MEDRGDYIKGDEYNLIFMKIIWPFDAQTPRQRKVLKLTFFPQTFYNTEAANHLAPLGGPRHIPGFKFYIFECRMNLNGTQPLNV